MVDHTSDLLENPLLTGFGEQTNSPTHDLDSIQPQSPTLASPLSLPFQQPYYPNPSSLPSTPSLPLMPPIDSLPSTQFTSMFPASSPSSLFSPIREEIVLPPPPQSPSKAVQPNSEQVTNDWWDFMEKSSTNQSSSTTHLCDNQTEEDKSLSSFLDTLDTEKPIAATAPAPIITTTTALPPPPPPPPPPTTTTDNNTFFQLEDNTESRNDVASMIYSDIDFLMMDHSKGSIEEQSVTDLQENQSQSPTMVELVCNVNGNQVCKFASTTTIQVVFQHFFSLRSGKPATKSQMAEHVIVNFQSPNKALPFDKTIKECNLVDKSRVESKKRVSG